MTPKATRLSRSALLLGALATFGCDDPSAKGELDDETYEDSEGEDSEGEDDEFRVSNGDIVYPYGGSEGITRTIVYINGKSCTGTLVDGNRWVLTAKHCAISLGDPVDHSSGAHRWVDQIIDHPSAGNDAKLIRLNQTLDVAYDGGVVVRSRPTSELVGDTITCMGYGASAYGPTCSTNADCQAGDWCADNQRCLTPGDALRRGDLGVGWVIPDATDYFFAPRNGLDQMGLPGDSGGPCWSRRDAATPAGITSDGQLLELQAVNSGWQYSVSGNTQLNVGTFADWIFWETRGSGIARFERPVNNQLHPGTFGNPNRPNHYARDFAFVAPHTGTVQISMSSAEIDPYLFVLDAGLAIIAQNDDFVGTDSRVTVSVVQGQTYVLRASSFAPWESGRFTLMISDRHLVPNVTQNGEITASDDLNPARPGRYKDDYWFFAPHSGRFAFQVDALGNPSVDTYLQLVHSTRDGAVIGYDDDGGPGMNSRLEVDLLEGEALWVRATTYATGATGFYSIRATPL